MPKDFTDAQLLDVTALSARNVWAVGTMTTCGCGPGSGVILHFNGRTWKRRPASGRVQTLSGVGASSARRVWAVGVAGDGDAPTRAQIARFNGARWRRVGAPSPGFVHKRFDSLSAVAARSAHDAWAVGETAGSSNHALIERWNGRHWKLVAGAPIGNALASVVALAPQNVWVVGTERVANQPDRAVIEHWDGHAFAAQPIG